MSGYRDGLEAATHRIQVLEQQLATRDEELRELRDTRGARLPLLLLIGIIVTFGLGAAALWSRAHGAIPPLMGDGRATCADPALFLHSPRTPYPSEHAIEIFEPARFELIERTTGTPVR